MRNDALQFIFETTLNKDQVSLKFKKAFLLLLKNKSFFFLRRKKRKGKEDLPVLNYV